jgi:hypothetical protein
MKKSSSVFSFAQRWYLAGVMSLPLEECNLLAHAVNELIDEQPPPARAPHRGVIPWATGNPDRPEDGGALDELLRQWLLSSARDQTRGWP